MKETKCEYCGKTIREDEVQTFQGVTMCKDCLEEKTVICTWCNNRIWNEDNYGNGSVDLCQTCYDNHYTNCERCGRLIHYDEAMYLEDDGDPYCESCYESEQKYQVIHDYNYKPEPIFYGEDDMYMGVELEIDKGGEYRENAEELLNIANFPKEHMYIKHDGSIDEGFEIVTHPMSLEYHENNMPWERIFEKALAMDYRSHQTSTCGLHIHVDRMALGSDHIAQEETIARIVYKNHLNTLMM